MQRESRDAESQMFETLEARRLLATFTVTNTEDSGDGSLRQAIEDANAASGADVIEFDDEVRGEIVLETGLVPDDELSIVGPGADLLTIAVGAGENDEPALLLDGVTMSVTGLAFRSSGPVGIRVESDAEVTLRDLTFTGGSPLLVESGTVTLRDSTLSQGDQGVRNDAGVVTILDTTIRGFLDFGGAGILNSGEMIIERSLIAWNTAQWLQSGFPPPPAPGGGILNSGSMTIRSSTIANNEATYGAGIFNEESGTIEIHNSTVHGNSASSVFEDLFGGGILNIGGPVTLHSTIVSGNTADAGSGPVANDIEGAVQAESSFNLIGDGTNAGGLTDGENGNRVGVDARLSGLGWNGGPTMSHLPMAGSPAIDAGDNPLGLTSDQRGFEREFGSAADIGAVESQPYAYPLLVADGERVSAVSAVSGTHHVLFRNTDGSLIALEGSGESWSAVVPRHSSDVPQASNEGVVWTDPKDGLTYGAAFSSDVGLVIYRRGDDGSWTGRSIGLGPATELTQFTARGGAVFLAGYDDRGDLRISRQTGAMVDGEWEWTTYNLSRRLDNQGMTAPEFVSLTSYVTPWNAWTIAGIDADGDIHGIWNAPSLDDWRVDNLSDITGAPEVTGQLTVTQTAWSAINLAATNDNGHLLVTWWIPRFGAEWVTNDLTAEQGADPLQPGTVTGFVTPWGGINYAAYDVDGEVIAYWWTASSRWNVDSLTRDFEDTVSRPAGPLTSHVSSRGELSVLGAGEDGSALRLWWMPGDGSTWTLTDLSAIAQRL